MLAFRRHGRALRAHGWSGWLFLRVNLHETLSRSRDSSGCWPSDARNAKLQSGPDPKLTQHAAFIAGCRIRRSSDCASLCRCSRCPGQAILAFSVDFSALPSKLLAPRPRTPVPSYHPFATRELATTLAVALSYPRQDQRATGGRYGRKRRATQHPRGGPERTGQSSIR